MITKRKLFELVYETYPDASILKDRKDYIACVRNCLFGVCDNVSEVKVDIFVKSYCERVARLYKQHKRRVHILNSTKSADIKFFDEVIDVSSVPVDLKSSDFSCQTEVSWLRHLSRKRKISIDAKCRPGC